MSLPILTLVRNANKSWTFTWPNQGQAFSRVVLWGNQLANDSIFSYTYANSEYTNFPPPLEIAYENQLTLSESYSPYLVMQWYTELCDHFLVQQLRGASWTTIERIERKDLWVFTYLTVRLKDETTFSYRVIAVDAYGNQSIPRLFVRYVVCPPAPPDPNISIGYIKPSVFVLAKS